MIVQFKIKDQNVRTICHNGMDFLIQVLAKEGLEDICVLVLVLGFVVVDDDVVVVVTGLVFLLL